MSQIDNIQEKLKAQKYFYRLSKENYLRVLDTPHVWGAPFGEGIMPQAWKRQAEFERAIVEIIQKSQYRCDLASLNSPDPDWVRAILGAMDTALTKTMGRTQPTQFRFLFGQTPMYPASEPPNYTDFKGALMRLVRMRGHLWEKMPEIWMGRFYRLKAGIEGGLLDKLKSVFGDFSSSNSPKMTWNHSKIIAVDGTEALVGGHNLNMDLFRSYPPVHDVSVVVHGDAAYGSQLFLNEMWKCETDLLTKEHLDIGELSWKTENDSNKPSDPFNNQVVQDYMLACQIKLIDMHKSGKQERVDDRSPNYEKRDELENREVNLQTPKNLEEEIRKQDLQTLEDLKMEVFQERIIYNQYDKFEDYKLATRILSVGKYWTGPDRKKDYKKGSEVMKEELIKSAKHSIKMSQMDLISAWKKNWSDHVVCHWIIEALLANKNLNVEVVVSPLDAGAGAEGDQYSFGSGASRTFELMEYYMTHKIDDTLYDDPDGSRKKALTRLSIAPFYYTDQYQGNMIEGETYHWPNLSEEGYTLTLKQPPLSEKPPKKGVIGSAVKSVINASGIKHSRKVPSAPGNHAKIMIVDDELYVVGSDNLYPGFLSEFNYLVEGEDAVKELLESYWKPLWQYSSPHSIEPSDPVIPLIEIVG